MGRQKLIHLHTKNPNIAGPSKTEIEFGEIAINYAKGHEKLYIKNDEGTSIAFPNENGTINRAKIATKAETITTVEGTSDVYRPVFFGFNGDNSKVVFNNKLKFNPSSGSLDTINGNFTGSVTATKITTTGKVTIKGSAAEHNLMTRGIIGSDGSGNEGPLYLNYASEQSTMFGTSAQGSLTSAGNVNAQGFYKNGSNDNYALTGSGGHHRIGNRNGDIEELVNFPSYADGDELKTLGFINPKYGTEGFGHPDEEFLKAICRWVCYKYGQDGTDKVLCGRISPNSQGYCHIHLYPGAAQAETKNPRYCSGVYYTLGGCNTPFGFNSYEWYYGGSFSGRANSASYASSAGNSDTVDGEHASAFFHKAGDKMAGDITFPNQSYGIKGTLTGNSGSDWLLFMDSSNRTHLSYNGRATYIDGQTTINGYTASTGYKKTGSSDEYALTGNGGHRGIRTANGKTDTKWVSGSSKNKELIDINLLSYWNGSYNTSGASNLTYCTRGAFGTIVTKNYEDFVIDCGTYIPA